MMSFKFKAWNKKTNKMIDLHKITPLALDANLKQDGVFIPFNDDYEILQSTGLCDKNGREIYEGDIIDNGHKGSTSPSQGIVVWAQKILAIRVDCRQESGFSNMALTGQMCQGKVEVIGNIYENKFPMEKTNGKVTEESPA
jgi:uncharacterized phage protein (TIGR01671 family)